MSHPSHSVRQPPQRRVLERFPADTAGEPDGGAGGLPVRLLQVAEAALRLGPGLHGRHAAAHELLGAHLEVRFALLVQLAPDPFVVGAAAPCRSTHRPLPSPPQPSAPSTVCTDWAYRRQVSASDSRWRRPLADRR